MCSVVDNCKNCCCSPLCFLSDKNQSENTTILAHNSSRRQIKDYGVGLLAFLVDKADRKTLSPTYSPNQAINSDWKYAIATSVLVACLVVPQFSAWLDGQSIVQQFQAFASLGTMTTANLSNVVRVGNSWVGKDFKPGETERCADFVRFVLRDAGVKVGVTQHPVDVGLQPSNGEMMARSFFGDDIGTILKDPLLFQPGDLVGFTNTYGSFPPGAITHVGIYVGNGMMVDRSTASQPVRSRSIHSFPNSQVIAVRLRIN